MTESAKQDTSKTPAESAATESAATESASSPGEAAPGQPGTAAPAAAGGAGEEVAKPDLDETKRKFREALERKNHAHADGQGQGGGDPSKISNAHGPAASRRNFRRKSG